MAFRKYMKTLKGFISILIVTLVLAMAAFSQTVLTKLDGGKVDVEAHNGKVVVLAIGATWLPLSENEAVFTNILAKKYAAKNVVIYFVATDSLLPKSKNYASNADVQKFASEQKLGVTILRDPDGALTVKKFNLEQIPSFVILDKQGNMSGSPFGGIDPKYDLTIPLSKAIDKLL